MNNMETSLLLLLLLLVPGALTGNVREDLTGELGSVFFLTLGRPGVYLDPSCSLRKQPKSQGPKQPQTGERGPRRGK